MSSSTLVDLVKAVRAAPGFIRYCGETLLVLSVGVDDTSAREGKTFYSVMSADGSVTRIGLINALIRPPTSAEAENFGTLAAENLAATTRRVAMAEQDARDAIVRADRSRYALSDYQQRVRQVAIGVWHEQGDWCLSGFNSALSRLDLESYEPTYRVRMMVEVDVTAESADDAETVARDGIDGDAEVEVRSAELISDRF